ncbi:response regulator transcription factor [Mucilaginibacter puniceus]
MRLPNILLLEDELQLAKIITETLVSRGFIVKHESNGRLGLEAVYKDNFDICIVDVMMPFMDGFTFVKELRKTDPQIPVLFLTARSQDKDLAEGYSSGGNDYLKKPFSLEELILRVNELLKRNKTNAIHSRNPVQFASFQLFPQRQVLVGSDHKIVKLSHLECELLLLLLLHKNNLLDRRSALMKLWGDDNPHNGRTMDVYITKLRKHLQSDATIQIINVRGLGYKLITD